MSNCHCLKFQLNGSKIVDFLFPAFVCARVKFLVTVSTYLVAVSTVITIVGVNFLFLDVMYFMFPGSNKYFLIQFYLSRQPVYYYFIHMLTNISSYWSWQIASYSLYQNESLSGPFLYLFLSHVTKNHIHWPK